MQRCRVSKDHVRENKMQEREKGGGGKKKKRTEKKLCTPSGWKRGEKEEENRAKFEYKAV